jgi:hypothetical protein
MAIAEKMAKKMSVGSDFLKNLRSINEIYCANLRLKKTAKKHRFTKAT